MKKATKTFVLLIVAASIVAILSSHTASATDKITICHAAGQDGTTQFVTLHIPPEAVYGQAGHLNEDGTTQAGHEDDYLGPCVTTTTSTTSTTSTTTSTSSTSTTSLPNEDNLPTTSASPSTTTLTPSDPTTTLATEDTTTTSVALIPPVFPVDIPEAPVPVPADPTTTIARSLPVTGTDEAAKVLPWAMLVSCLGALAVLTTRRKAS